MANMSYCRFENTNNDLSDCVEALDNTVKEGGQYFSNDYGEKEEFSEYENSAIQRLYENCKAFVAEYEAKGLNDD